MQNIPWVVASALFVSIAHNAGAQSYPAKPLRLIVASSATSGADIAARAAGQGLAEYLGQQVIVENRAGSGKSGAQIEEKFCLTGNWQGRSA